MIIIPFSGWTYVECESCFGSWIELQCLYSLRYRLVIIDVGFRKLNLPTSHSIFVGRNLSPKCLQAYLHGYKSLSSKLLSTQKHSTPSYRRRPCPHRIVVVKKSNLKHLYSHFPAIFKRCGSDKKKSLQQATIVDLFEQVSRGRVWRVADFHWTTNRHIVVLSEKRSCVLWSRGRLLPIKSDYNKLETTYFENKKKKRRIKLKSHRFHFSFYLYRWLYNFRFLVGKKQEIIRWYEEVCDVWN